MQVRARQQRLERRDRPGGACGHNPPAEVWLPENGHDGRPPGYFPCSGSNAVLVIYQAEASAPAGADA